MGAYAAPSPSATVAPAGAPSGGCPKNVTLSITAPAGAATSGFSTKQLSAQANKALEVCFQNNDLTTHNFEVWNKDPLSDPSAKNYATEDPFTGPASELVKVPALPSGTYFYRCIVHPTVMTGTLTVK